MARCGLIQTRCGESPEENLRLVIERIRELAADGAQVICLQELFHLQYPCQSEEHDRFALAESIPGPATQQMSELAAELEVVLIVPLFEKRAPGVYHNSAAVIDADGSLCGMYRKMHIPDDPLYYEKFYFTPGDLGFRIFDTRYAKVGVAICWDQWFPECARLMALQGAELLVYPTAIGWIPGDKEATGASQYSAWQTMLRSHAIANGLYVVAPNRVGVEGDIDFWGGSFIADPYGNVIAQCSHDADETIAADCCPDVIDTARTQWPFFRDRRIDAYGGLLQRWNDSDNALQS